jgi:hypothetical protein
MSPGAAAPPASVVAEKAIWAERMIAVPVTDLRFQAIGSLDRLICDAQRMHVYSK